MAGFQIGMMGLGVMGANLARNLASKGFSVAGYDLAPEKRSAFAAADASGALVAMDDIPTFLGSLETPRRIILLVPSGVVDTAIASLKPYLSKGDLLIDLGNSFFMDT